MSKQDRMTDIKVYRESLQPGETYIWVAWKDLDGSKHKCFPDIPGQEDVAKEFARSLRDFKIIHDVLEF
jgi:hypothetical protein